jgi:hypothetical protein
MERGLPGPSSIGLSPLIVISALSIASMMSRVIAIAAPTLRT